VIVIGIDPDNKKSGLAVYRAGKLVELHNLTYKEFCTQVIDRRFGEAVFVVEDSEQNKFMYARNRGGPDQVATKIAQDVGRVKRLGTCMADLLEVLGYKVHRVKPCKKNFAKDKARFEYLTGWEGRSNPETRSAAYFGLIFAK